MSEIYANGELGTTDDGDYFCHLQERYEAIAKHEISAELKALSIPLSLAQTRFDEYYVQKAVPHIDRARTNLIELVTKTADLKSLTSGAYCSTWLEMPRLSHGSKIITDRDIYRFEIYTNNGKMRNIEDAELKKFGPRANFVVDDDEFRSRLTAIYAQPGFSVSYRQYERTEPKLGIARFGNFLVQQASGRVLQGSEDSTIVLNDEIIDGDHKGFVFDSSHKWSAKYAEHRKEIFELACLQISNTMAEADIISRWASTSVNSAKQVDEPVNYAPYNNLALFSNNS